MNSVRRDRRKAANAAIATLALSLIVAIGVRSSAESTKSDDAVARLASRLADGSAALEYGERGYLPSLLRLLGIDVDSQVLVFSKTSFQHALITPTNPRAVYFNDNVAVGMVPGGSVYEIVALEPSHGLAFYTLDTKKSDHPVFQRRGVECLFCHGPGNKGAAALVVASVIPNAEGVPAYTSAFIDTIDHRTPFERRWGGWYVTGTHGSQTHMGNAVAPDPENPIDLDTTRSQNVTSLADRFDVTKYLTGTSDIVALMTLEHQVGAVNRLGAIGVQYDRAQRFGTADADAKQIDAEIRDLVDYLTFADEAPLRQPVHGVSAFTTTFAAQGPKDRLGRSLREFDLTTRLFRHKLSYMIYSDLFDRLPPTLRARIYTRLRATLAERDPAAIEIMRDTKSDLPEGW